MMTDEYKNESGRHHLNQHGIIAMSNPQPLRDRGSDFGASDICRKLRSELRANGVTYENLRQVLDLSVGAIGHRFDQRGTPMLLDEFLAICWFADITPHQFFDRSHAVSTREMKYISLFRQMTKHQRAALLKQMELIVEGD